MVDDEREDELDRVFHCLANSSRRRILALLRESDELKLTDIAAAFDMSLNGVSKHIKVLEKSGLLLRRVMGREHFLRANWENLQSSYEFLHFYHHFWSQRLDALTDYIQENHNNKNKK